jgi:hypothetical protein
LRLLPEWHWTNNTVRPKWSDTLTCTPGAPRTSFTAFSSCGSSFPPSAKASAIRPFGPHLVVLMSKATSCIMPPSVSYRASVAVHSPASPPPPSHPPFPSAAAPPGPGPSGSFPSGAVSRPAALPLSCVFIVFGFCVGLRVVVLRASGEQGAP